MPNKKIESKLNNSFPLKGAIEKIERKSFSRRDAQAFLRMLDNLKPSNEASAFDRIADNHYGIGEDDDLGLTFKSTTLNSSKLNTISEKDESEFKIPSETPSLSVHRSPSRQ